MACKNCLRATKEFRKRNYIVFKKEEDYYVSFKEQIKDLNKIYGKYEILLIK
jgi:hypothetical protein